MKKKEKKEKTRKKNFLNEVKTIIYEQQLIDDNRQLVRLQINNEELETKMESLSKKLNELEENKADLTSHLQLILLKKTQEAEELHERLSALEKLYIQEQLAFKKKEESLENEFCIMEHNLTAEIKLAAGKLNSLEEWRLNRIDLMTKFDEQEKHMIEQEIRHKKILYEAEKKFIIGKTKMQNELENRLADMSKSFQAATTLRLTDATQYTVNENISLHKELNHLLNQWQEIDTTMLDYKECERTCQLHSSLYEVESRLALKKVVKQNRAIKYLVMEHERMCRIIESVHRGGKYSLRSDKTFKEAAMSCFKTQKKVRLLEQNIEVTRINKDNAMKEVLINCHNIQRFDDVITKIKETIKQTLMMQAELIDKENACSICFFDVKEKLLQSLFEVLENCQESSIEYEEEINFEPIENLYEFGNLGLIPTFLNIYSSHSKSDSINSSSNVKKFFDHEKNKEISNNVQCLCD